MDTDIPQEKIYSAPELKELGDFSELTMGNMGSFNDGGGAGAGMAALDGQGGMDPL